MRLKPLGDVSLRSRAALEKFMICAKRARNFGLNINQYALLGNHLHLIAEARSNAGLTRGMRSFGGSLGKTIRAFAGGRGSVFAGRFHVHTLKTPREYKNAPKYVLLNHARHANEIASPDRFSSGPFFRRWSRLIKDLSQILLEGLDEYPLRNIDHVVPAESWLGRVGWCRA